MIVLKSTYNKLYDLFIKEKHGALDLYKEKERWLRENQQLKEEISQIKAELRKLGE